MGHRPNVSWSSRSTSQSCITAPLHARHVHAKGRLGLLRSRCRTRLHHVFLHRIVTLGLSFSAWTEVTFQPHIHVYCGSTFYSLSWFSTTTTLLVIFFSRTLSFFSSASSSSSRFSPMSSSRSSSTSPSSFRSRPPQRSFSSHNSSRGFLSYIPLTARPG